MADRKILFRSGANVNESSPTADRARVIGLLSGAATVSLENSSGQTLSMGATEVLASGNIHATGTLIAGASITIDGTANTIVSSGTTASIYNTTSTTVNFGGVATTVSIGAATGTATINNATTAIAGILAANGASMTTDDTTFALLNATATTINAFGAAATVNIGAAASTFATGFSAVTSSQGTVALLNATTTTVNFGGAATAMSVGNAAGTVTFPGDIAANGGDITTSSATFNLVNGTATTVNFGQAATSMIMAATTGESRFRNNLRVNGNLIVEGTTTTVNSTQVLLDDNHLYLNNAYTTASAETGGLVVNYLPIATTTTVAGAYVAGVAAVSNPTVTTTGSGTFAVGQFIQIGGTVNAGLYEVLSHVTTTLTIRGVGTTATVEDFTQNQFVAAASDGATITRLTVSTIRAGTDGVWETGSGSTTPVTFSDLSTGVASGWTDDGTVVRLTTAGDVVSIGFATDIGGQLQQNNLVAADHIHILRGHASQSGDYSQMQDSAGTMIASFNSAGNLIFGNTDHTIGYSSASTRILTFDNAGAGALASIRPGTTAETDLGVTGTRFKDGWFSGDVTAAGNLVSGATITVNGTTNTITYSAAGSIVTTAGALTLTGAGGVTTASNFSTSGTGTFSFGSSGAVTAGGNPTFNFGTSLSTFGGATSTAGTATFTGNITQTGATTFGTGTGAVSLNGATTVTGTNTFTTGTGVTTVNGNFTQTGATTFGTGTGAVSLNGDTTLATAKSLLAAGTATVDLSGGSGVFKTTTGAATIGPGAVTVSGTTTFTAAGTALTVTNNSLFSGTTTTTGTATFNGAMNLGDAAADAITVNGTTTFNNAGVTIAGGFGLNFSTTASTIQYGGTANFFRRSDVDATQVGVNSTIAFGLPLMTTAERDALDVTGTSKGMAVFNTTTNTTDIYDGGAWRQTSTGAASGWLDGGALVSLTTSTDRVDVGGDDGAKLNIRGTADVITLNVKGFAGQTANLATFENSAGTDQLTISPAGDVVIAGNFQINGNTQIGDGAADTTTLFSDNIALKDNSTAKTMQPNTVSAGTAVSFAVKGGGSSAGDAASMSLVGGLSTHSAPTSDGGNVIVTGGAQTNATGGRGGDGLFTGGAATGAPGGSISINAGAGTPAIAAINIGTASGTISSITIGNSTDNPTISFPTSGAITFGTSIVITGSTNEIRPSTNTVAGSSIGTSSFGWGAIFFRNVADTATVNLRASGAGVDGALAIGYDNAGNTVITTTNVSDALGQLDAAIVGGGSITFTAGATIDSGTLVRVSATDTVIHAIATSEAATRVIGVAEAAIVSATTGTITTTFGGLIENLRLVNGLTPTFNDELFVSDATAGRATTTAPTASGSVVKKVGMVKDASAYVTVTNPFVEAIFQPEPGTLIA